jgi:hypothetical protein
MSIPKTVLEITSIQLIPVMLMNPEQAFMMGKFIEMLIMTMKEGKVTSFEELNEEVIEKLLDLDHPFLD